MESQNLLYAVLFLIIGEFEAKLKTGNLNIKANEMVSYLLCKSLFKMIEKGDHYLPEKYLSEIIQDMKYLAGSNWDEFSEIISNINNVKNLEEYKNIKNFNLKEIGKIEIDLSNITWLD